jgi:polysaccharide deacetylase family sporulation protein PdaB
VILCGFETKPVEKNREYYEKRGEIVWEVPVDEKKIAFTFDDGPSPETTEPILDLLKINNAKATFFVIGKRADQYPDLIKREIAEGHELANHTYNHLYIKTNIKTETIQDEIVRTEQSLEHLTGTKPLLFRPPGGYYNEKMIQVAKKLGYTTVMWSWHQDTNDWRSPGVGRIVNKVLNNVRNGDIVLFHDYTPGSTQTVQALEIIIPELIERGYQIVTVSELIKNKKEQSIPIHH